ncbi:MAG: hypothetical protein IBX61_08380 [Thermoleophilia bacterium]|nr:hypothetical protein [Thermoleophilia bacterium]
MTAVESAVVSTVGVVAVFVVTVGVVEVVAVSSVVGPVLSPPVHKSRPAPVAMTATARVLPIMMIRFFDVRAMLLPFGLERLMTFRKRLVL